MLKRILSIYAPYKKDVAKVLALTFVMQAVNLTMPYISGRMIDSMIQEKNIWITIGLALTAIPFAFFNYFMSYKQMKIDQSRLWFPIQEYLRMKTIDTYLGFSLGQIKQLSNNLTRQIMSNGEDSMMRLARTAVQKFLPIVVRFIVIFILLLQWQSVFAKIILGGLAIYVFVQKLMNDHYVPRIAEQRDKNNLSSKHRGEVIQGAGVVKSYSKESEIRESYRKTYRQSVETSLSVNLYTRRIDGLVGMIIDFTQLAVSLMGIVMIYSQEITIGQFTMLAMWCSQLVGIIKSLDEDYLPMLSQISDVKKFFELVDAPPAIREIENPVRIDRAHGCIEVRNLWFAYPNKDGAPGRSILKGIDLTIAPGEHVAIVGTSGSGKTTLMDLLRRGFDPEAGEIRLDGISLRNIALKDICRNMAIVDQGSLMMDMSIRDNILLGTHSPLSDENLLSICQMVGLNMTKFEGGLEKRVGEYGNLVSGGERQRIAIARALASNAPVMIFDEPTSSLDAILEDEIRQAIAKVSSGRTTITIAHRLATIQHADRIFLMEDGKITTSGTHRELLRKSGRYMELVEKQKIFA